MSPLRVSIIGAGPGDLSLLSLQARQRLETAELVLATGRLHRAFLPAFPHLQESPWHELGQRVLAWAATAVNAVTPGETNITPIHQAVILVSGDVGFYSASSTLQSELEAGPAELAIEWLNGFSSLQYLAAKLQIPYETVRTVSVHGRESRLLAEVSYNERVFVLTGGLTLAHYAIAELVRQGLGQVTIHVGEDLGLPTERLLSGSARELACERFGSLAVVLIHNPDFVAPWQTVRDEDLVRGAVPMTKQAVREVSLAQLEVGPAETVYDIGAGTGAVSIALSRRAFAGRVYAIEKNPEALALLATNRQKLGAFNLQLVEGKAPDALADLPAPDRVFIGGSDGQIEAIFDQIFAKTAHVRIVVNAITLETLQRTIDAFQARQIEPDICCVNIAQAEKAGRYHLMKAQNPVYVISGGGKL